MKSQKCTRTGRKRGQKKCHSESMQGSESEYHDSEEDELMCRETARLFESHGNSEPLWTLEPDLVGMTKAMQAYARNKKG